MTMKLRSALLLANFTIVVVCSLVAVTVVPHVTRTVFANNVAGALGSQAERIAATAIVREKAMANDTTRPMDSISGDLFGVEIAIVDRNGLIRRSVPHPAGRLGQQGSQLTPQLSALLGRVLSRGETTGGSAIAGSGDEVMVGVAPVRDHSQQIIGAVFVAQPFSEEPGASSRRLIFLLMAASLGITGALSMLASQLLVRKLRTLQDAADHVASGDLTHRVPADGPAEIQQVGAAFNHMAGRVEALVSGLHEAQQLRRDLHTAMAHELRTPVTSVLGFSKALNDGIIPPDQVAQYHGIIYSEAQRLADLIEDLFQFAKLEAGKLELCVADLDATAWLRCFGGIQAARLQANGYILEVELPPDVPMLIRGDQGRLEQVVQNLVDNAARYTPRQKPIVLSLTRTATHVRITVTDQGPGVADQDVPRIWDRYYQGRNPGEKKGGAGLGLAIVKSIVSLHGGSVGVDTQPGAGATFWFEIPRTTEV